MTATAKKTEEPQATRPSVEAHAEAARRWRDKVAALGQELTQAQAELDAAEGAAARAALAGEELPDMGGLESKVRALRKARVMAQEHAEAAEEELAAAKREEAAEAAHAVAVQLVAEAEGLDDTLAELGHRVATLQRLGRRHSELASAAGIRRRREAHDLSPTALAGAVMHAAPEVFSVLNCPRPTSDQRRPLAEALAARHGLGPHLHEVPK
jgi:hypothetical protein